MKRREPGTPLAKTSKQLVDEAHAKVITIPVERAVALLDDPTVLFVDIRDPVSYTHLDVYKRQGLLR